ncbi:hypothetical protein LSH36_98g04070 [Paralvinella palmiformis]|uniref:Sulfotransferase domain-containing protein n=1 Tax=Paralvinella palmiformis TaxID=53620 RepID=A0AAD9K041_9ANNE|nr:hypothetical protein LSH36_98g04070 [Paralvinella palmiformis]
MVWLAKDRMVLDRDVSEWMRQSHTPPEDKRDNEHVYILISGFTERHLDRSPGRTIPNVFRAINRPIGEVCGVRVEMVTCTDVDIHGLEIDGKHNLFTDHLFVRIRIGSMASLEQIKQFISEDKLNQIQNLDFDNDILINGFPRTGTTWLQELVWLIQNGGDVDKALQSPIGCRVPFLESRGFDWEHNVSSLEQHPHPRILKSHLPPQTFRSKLDGKVKVIVPIRNPKDTVASQYYFYKIAKFIPFELPLVNVFGAFLDETSYGLLNVFGNYFPWYTQAAPLLQRDNVLLVKYEDLKSDLKANIRSIASFLGRRLEEKSVEAIAKHCSFESMKRNAMVNPSQREIFDGTKGDFFHIGEVGYWKGVLTKDQSKLIEKMYKSTLKKAGIQLRFE